MGRPSKRTAEREERLLTALAAGNTIRASCIYAGIGVQTMADWRERSRDFRDAVEKAEADAEVRFVAQIAKAAHDGTWQAAAWWLERRRPLDYGRTWLTASDDAPVEPKVITVTFDRPLADGPRVLNAGD
jgi:hypothetical protein